MGVFRLRNPLFPILGFWTPVRGGRIRKLSPSHAAYKFLTGTFYKFVTAQNFH